MADLNEMIHVEWDGSEDSVKSQNDGMRDAKVNDDNMPMTEGKKQFSKTFYM